MVEKIACQVLFSNFIYSIYKFILILVLFPVLSGAQIITMGDTNVESETDSGNGNLILANAVTLSQAGILHSMSFYVRVAAGNLRLGVYDSTGPNGGPGNLLSQSADLTVTGTGWLTAALPAVTLTPGMYWLAYLPSSDSLGFWCERQTGQVVWASQTYGVMPSSFPSGISSGITNWSMYATLQVTPTPTPTPTPVPTPTPSQKNVQWNAPSAVTGYKVFWGTTQGGPYSNSADAGNNLTFTISGLTTGTTYFAIVESYDVNGNLSCPTNEISFIAP